VRCLDVLRYPHSAIASPFENLGNCVSLAEFVELFPSVKQEQHGYCWCMPPADHGQGEPALSVQHFGNPATAAEQPFQVQSGEAPLFKGELYCCYKIRWSNGRMTGFVVIHQNDEHVKAFLLSAAGLSFQAVINLC